MDALYQTAVDAVHTKMLVPGDCVFFANRTLRQAGLRSWLADVITVLAQWLGCSTAMGHYDGFWRFCHVGVIVEWHGAVHLLEWLPGGMQCTNAAQRLAMHRGQVIIIPLSDRYRNTAFFAPDRIYQWIEQHCNDDYHWGGLIFSILHTWLGSLCPGKFFCSEAVVSLYKYIGVVRSALPVMRKHPAQGELKPQAYAPCEVADLPQLKRSGMWEYKA